MRVIISVILVVLPVLKIFAQGVEFDTVHNWTEIKAMAKQEGKYIFVDCYATWCLPCKRMDADVYPTREVAEYMRKHFISVKIQMDSTAKDNAVVKAWHGQAADFAKRYNVSAFPGFLFFSPDGHIVHKGVGFMPAADFLRLVNEATDPGKQFYTLLGAYQKNQLDYTLLPVLNKQATILRDRSLALETGEKYMSAYIEKLGEPILYNRETLRFISSYLSEKHRMAFSFFSKKTATVDSIVGRRDFALKTIEHIISVEEIQKKIVQDGDWKKTPLVTNPSWALLQQNIARKHPVVKAEKLILQAKITWYVIRKNWLEATKARLIFYEKYLVMPEPGYEMMFSMSVNNPLYNEVFQNITDTALLIRASKMQKKFILDLETEKDEAASKANSIDTYANLLYKAGLVSEAISWQTKATLLDPESKEFNDNLDKMRHGAPTWKAANPVKPNNK